MGELFPILDISYLSNNFQDSETWRSDANFQSDQRISQLVQELQTGFETWGFLYIKGHNIPENMISKAFDHSKEFFNHPSQYKAKYSRSGGISEGFLGPSNEVFDTKKPFDIKEAFDFRPETTTVESLAKEMPETVDALTQLFQHCKQLVIKFLRLLAVALGIDTEHFVKLHSNIGEHRLNGTSLRTLYYPLIQDENIMSNDENRRCREHTDYGTITFLFQDQIGGLEVQSPSGKFVRAKPIPGTIVINAGDLLNAWSNGKYRATTHRVTIPSDRNKLLLSRQSMAFFCHPNHEVSIKHGDEKQTAYQHLNNRFNETIDVK